MNVIYDYIICGGGSAGCVLANRLSARSSNKVLLLEAGRDTPPGKVPEAILDSYAGTAYLNPAYTWADLKVTTEVIPHNDPGAPLPALRFYEQARVLGGGSSINGMLANRGAPSDYDEWHSRGATGWNWDAVLPYFKKLERDLDFSNQWHGHNGPVPVRRIQRKNWPGHADAAAKAFEEAGWAYLPDQNAEWVDGYYPSAISNVDDRRVSAAIAYLDANIRSRSNLTIATDTRVSSLVFDGRRCTGVIVMADGQMKEYRGNEIILSCGAIHSPAHLMRAGIGPAGYLRDLGINIRVALPGVGQRLQDHPAAAVAAFLKPNARILSHHSRRHELVSLRYSSKLPGVPAGDMVVFVISRSSWHSVGRQLGSLVVTVNKTYSETGQVKLRTSNWRDEPSVDFNLLSDYRDLKRMMDGIRTFAALHLKNALKAVAIDPFPASYSDNVRKVGKLTLKNKIKTDLFAKLLDGPAPLRRLLMKSYLTEGPTLHDILNDDDALETFVRKGSVGVWHASCSCRMGSADDPMAVTDNAGLVRGVEGLRVVDASIFPIIPCANTNFPAIMTGEKCADAILSGHP